MADPAEAIETGNLPTVITAAGLTPTAPVELRATLTNLVAKTNPGYVNNLPGSLIEDIASTDVQALVMMDQARVEALNDLTPYGCNEFVLVLLGKVYGVAIGQPVNTSVFVQFTGLPGFVIGKGFLVSDGNNVFSVRDGGIIGTSGVSSLLFCVATLSGSFAVPAGTVTQLITPPPTGFTLAVVNPEPGIPAVSAETATQYRSRVLRAGLAASQGMARYLRTLLTNVAGVQDRLVGIQMQQGGGWMIIVGGGDPYEVAYAIYTALFDISTLVGSVIHITGITNANPAVATTDINHGFVVGDIIDYQTATPTVYNGTYRVFGVLSPNSFTMGSAYPANALTAATWVSGVITFTTLTPHLLASGASPVISGCIPDTYNAIYPTCTVTGTHTFTVPRAGNPGAIVTLGQLNAGIEPFDSTGMPAYIGGGTVTPNHRNITVSITDYPDSYPITYVIPPQQSLHIVVTWKSSSPNFVSAAAVAQLATPALIAYVNSVLVGAPLNIMQMEDAFTDSIAAILPPAFVAELTFVIDIDGVSTPPVGKTVSGDPQSYFFADDTDFTFVEVLGP